MTENSQETHRSAWSIAEAAEALGLSINGLRKLINTGQLPAIRLGRRVVIREKDFQRFMDNMELVKTQNSQ